MEDCEVTTHPVIFAISGKPAYTELGQELALGKFSLTTLTRFLTEPDVLSIPVKWKLTDISCVERFVSVRIRTIVGGRF